MKKRIYKITIFWIISALIFSISAYLLVVSALGYRIDWQYKKLTKTGIIYLKSNLENVGVFLDEKPIEGEMPVSIFHLLPGRYSVRVSKPEYHDWTATMDVLPGFVTKHENIVLVKDNPEFQKPTDREIEQLDKFEGDKNISISNDEIYLVNSKIPKLITRLSQQVKSAVLYPDKKHIAYQVGNSLKFSEIDGSKTVEIMELDSPDSAKLMFSDNGQVLFVKQNDKTIKAVII